METVAEIKKELETVPGVRTQPSEEPCRTCDARTVEAWVPINTGGESYLELLYQFCEGEERHIHLIN